MCIYGKQWNTSGGSWGNRNKQNSSIIICAVTQESKGQILNKQTKIYFQGLLPLRDISRCEVSNACP